jgi:hypothetical protein
MIRSGAEPGRARRGKKIGIDDNCTAATWLLGSLITMLCATLSLETKGNCVFSCTTAVGCFELFMILDVLPMSDMAGGM